MLKRSSKSRYTIGMLINQLEGRSQSSLWQGIVDIASEYDIDLILFPGKSPGTTLSDESRHNVVYDLVNIENLDGLIVASGILGNYIGKEGLLELFKPFSSIPMVSISLELEGIPSVMVDNKSGMREMINHLIEVHGYRRIAFIRGLETNIEAEERYNAYLEVLKQNDIEINQDLIVQGDFTRESGIEAVKILLDKRKVTFDAIVSANDDMAFSAYNFLLDRGYRIPEDIAITGFDDIEEMRYLPSAFTTVSQPRFEQARKAGKILFAMLSGEKRIPNVVSLPTRLIVRQTCGCNAHQLESISIVTEPDSIKPFKYKDIFTGKRENIIQKALKILNVSTESKIKYTQWLEELLNSLSLGRSSREFINVFESILIEIIERAPHMGDYIAPWQNVLTFLRSNIMKSIPDLKLKLRFECIFQEAQILFARVIMRRETGRRIRLEYLQWHLRSINENLHLATDIQTLLKTIQEECQYIGIKSCYLVLYDTDLLIKKGADWKLPEYSKLMMAYNEKGTIVKSTEPIRFETKLLLPQDFISDEKRGTLIVKPLFSREYQFGYILYELSSIESVLYETFREMISNALMIALLFKEREKEEEVLKRVLVEMEYLNKELRSLSLRDELTGLYNRRGFLTHAEQHYKMAVRKKEEFLLFFADLDRLKYINDSYGHEEGDFAIIKTGEILKETFRDSDIIARLGGDEFTVLTVNSTPNYEKYIRNRIQESLENYNKNSKKNYELGVSLGVASFQPGKTKSFQDLMVSADKDLYKNKRKRKNK